MSSFGILHLSDLHCQKETSPAALLGPLREDLQRAFSNTRFAFVVVSGDFIDKGDASGYSVAAEFLREVAAVAKVPLDRFIFCPGNHDVEEVAAAFALRSKVGPGEEEVKKLDEDAYRVRVLSEYSKRFSGYLSLCRDLLGHPGNPSDLARVHTYPAHGVQFLSLNSACRIDKFRLKEAVIDPADFSRALAEADVAKQPLRIAVWHHAVLGRWSMAEAGGYLQRLAEAGFSMLLHGDVHETRAMIANPFRDGLPIAGAGAFGANQASGNLYNVVEVEDRQVTVHIRKQEEPNSPFDGHAVFGSKEARKAHYSFPVGGFGAAAASVAAAAGDPTRYFAYLDETTKWIDFRGLQIGSGKATRFAIERLYVPLETSGGGKLEDVLTAPRVVIQGDAGSGKTTFLRQLTRKLLRDGQFPVFIRISELDQHMDQCWSRNVGPTVKHAPQWLRHYLSSRGWDLSEEYFEKRLREGRTVLLLDGLDEAADDQRRSAMAKMIRQAAIVYPLCPLVVTTRPAAYRDETLLDDSETTRIAGFDDGHVDDFLKLWSRCLHTGNEDAAEVHRQTLREAIDSKPEIRRMARNPVMLTALAVVHWNDRRLPDQRAELYESVLGWLAKARDRQGRESAESCLRLLGRLALGMQEWPGGLRLQIGKDPAAALIAGEFRAIAPSAQLEQARQFLTSEEVDSGIISSFGTDVRFWHRTFQEHLAARTLAGLPDAEQWTRVAPRIREHDWREVSLLLAGLLHARGRERLDWLFRNMLASVPDGAGLADQARCFGLVGAMLRDLTAVKYELPAETAARFAHMQEAVMGIFTAEGAAKVPWQERIEAADALGASDPRLKLPKDKGYFVAIPGGTFWMGGQSKKLRDRNFDKNARDNESVRQVTSPPLHIGRYPVTIWEYGRYLEETGVAAPPDWDEQQVHPNRPVTSVSWYDATAFCHWAGCRLPWEEEWEFAARGDDGREFPWGGKSPDAERINYNGNVGAPSPVGAFPASHARGEIADMAGNVWEWTACPSEYRTRLILRGGSWDDSSLESRSAFRYLSHMKNRAVDIGFRCVRA